MPKEESAFVWQAHNSSRPRKLRVGAILYFAIGVLVGYHYSQQDAGHVAMPVKKMTLPGAVVSSPLVTPTAHPDLPQTASVIAAKPARNNADPPHLHGSTETTSPRRSGQPNRNRPVVARGRLHRYPAKQRSSVADYSSLRRSFLDQ